MLLLIENFRSSISKASDGRCSNKKCSQGITNIIEQTAYVWRLSEVRLWINRIEKTSNNACLFLMSLQQVSALISSRDGNKPIYFVLGNVSRLLLDYDVHRLLHGITEDYNYHFNVYKIIFYLILIKVKRFNLIDASNIPR